MAFAAEMDAMARGIYPRRRLLTQIDPAPTLEQILTPCATPAELSAFVATGTAGSISLCPKDDMREDLGTLTVHGQQRISVVGRAAARATHPPRFFGLGLLGGADRGARAVTRAPRWPVYREGQHRLRGGATGPGPSPSGCLSVVLGARASTDD